MKYVILATLIGCVIGCEVCSYPFHEGKTVHWVHEQLEDKTLKKGFYNLTGKFEKVDYETDLGCNMVFNVIKWEEM